LYNPVVDFVYMLPDTALPELICMNVLIVTLRIDLEAQKIFDDLREQYFPPHLNYLKSHLTLFHHLPADDASITEIIKQHADHGRMSLRVNNIRHTGFGVAYTIEAPEILTLRASLANAFRQWLTPQDQQKFQPHITVQNKVTAEVSKQLSKQLLETFVPFEIEGEGLDTWLYKNGPWEHIEYYRFADTTGTH